MAIKYGKHVKLRPSSEIPALFDIKDLEYVLIYKEHIKDVLYFMKYLYYNRRKTFKYDRDRTFPSYRSVINRRSYVNKPLVIRLVEWQYTDYDGFYIKDEPPRLRDAIFISICVRDYLNDHRKANK